MFRKMQIKLTIFYTLVVAIILIASNLSIYFLLASYNSNQLASETQRMLSTIQSSEWLYELEETKDVNELNIEDRSTEDRDDLIEDKQIENSDESKTDDNKSPENSDSRDSDEQEDTTDSDKIDDDQSDDDLTEEEKKALEEEKKALEEEKKAIEEDKQIEEDKDEEEDKEDEESLDGVYNSETKIKLLSHTTGFTLNLMTMSSSENELKLPSSDDILIPNALDEFSFYYIYSLDGELIRWKNEFRNIHNDIKALILDMELNGQVQVYEFNNDNKYYFLMQKLPIISEGYELGYYVVGRDVSIAYDTIENLGKIIMISLIVGIVLSLFIGYIIAGQTIKPIKEAFIIKQKFLADASHELRTPLSVVLLSCDTLDEELNDNEVFSKQVVKDIKEEAIVMKSLVEKLLHLARHDTGKVNVKKEVIELPMLIENVVNSYRYIGNTKEIDLILHPFKPKDGTKNCYVVGDQDLLRTVFSVMIDNGIKYSSKQSTVTIDITSVTMNKLLKKNDSYIKIDVTDTGKGMSKEDLSLIFNRFYRIETSRSKKIAGHGLGLSIAKEIITHHKGTIEVASEIGLGTCFTILLPRYPMEG